MRRMLEKSLGGLAVALAIVTGASAAEAPEPLSRDWPQQGVFGTFDRHAVQRGFQVFSEVCAGCHGVKYLAFRNLEALGYDEAEIAAIAAQYTVMDGPDEYGDMFERPAVASDRKPVPFANERQARAANGGALPPDLSLITKARAGGEDYLYSLLVGYEEPPAGVELPPGMNYNAYFPGHQIAMAQPLYDDMVEYQDGTVPTISQMAADVTQFLAWVAEPKMEERKQTGIMVMLFLLILAIIFYAYKRRIWADIH